MELQRTILLIFFAMTSLMLWSTWQNEHVQKINNQAETIPVKNNPVSLADKTAPVSSPTTLATSVNNKGIAHETGITQTGKILSITTDLFSAQINTSGGDLVNLQLLRYPKSLNSSTPIQLLNSSEDNFYIIQSALMSANGPDTTQLRANYETSQNKFELKPGQKTLDVTLTWQNPEGLQVQKIYRFHQGQYLVDLIYQIENKSHTQWQGSFIGQLTRKEVSDDHQSMFQVHPYIGAAVSSPEERYREISFKKMDSMPLNESITDGWAAMVQHYFLTALIPPKHSNFHYFTTATPDKKLYTIGLQSQPLMLEPGERISQTVQLYAGPEITHILKTIAPGLDLTVSYGFLWPISSAIFWMMKIIYDFCANWGWAIVLVTCLIKLLFYPLANKSYRSMAAMRKIQPKIEAIREQYKDDNQKLSQAMMELYRTEKMNPLGGCLPILIQIPVFFALYMVLVESVEFRLAPWILWIKDLASPDPFYVLPILMGITMLIQQKLNPPPPDPMQAKMMMFLPVVFTALFINFPSGLVLYWVVNNTLSILQQWYITRQYELTH